MPRRWHQVCGIIFAGDGGKKARSPGRVRISRKPLRGECRMFSGVTVVTNARVYYSTRAAADAPSVRHSPRPLISEGGTLLAKPRAHRAAGGRRRVSKRTTSCRADRRATEQRRNRAKHASATIFSSSFSLTGYLPVYSSGCLPTFSMYQRKPQRILACIAPATPINSLAT